jgi:glyoxylase-like metal-dependent hydrolase (beta-lactamase superfamily II)
MALKVHHLNCVDIESPGNGRAVGHCLLLETEARLILVDAGIGRKDTQEPESRIGKDLIDIVGFRFDEEQTAARQIERLGLNPEKVTDCIISHLDPDHIGGLADFPDATVHIGLEEYKNFKSGNPRYLVHQLGHEPLVRTYDRSTGRWFDFEARRITAVPEAEIYLIPLFGHTLGHCGVAVKHAADWLFYVADAYYLRAELTEPEHPVHALAEVRADNNLQRLYSLDRVRRFVREHPSVPVFSFHDPEELQPWN